MPGIPPNLSRPDRLEFRAFAAARGRGTPHSQYIVSPFIFTDFNNSFLPFDAPEPIRMIKSEQHIIFFDDLDTLKPFEVPYEEIRANKKRLETGDAYYIRDNVVTKIKMAKA